MSILTNEVKRLTYDSRFNRIKQPLSNIHVTSR